MHIVDWVQKNQVRIIATIHHIHFYPSLLFLVICPSSNVCKRVVVVVVAFYTSHFASNFSNQCNHEVMLSGLSAGCVFYALPSHDADLLQSSQDGPIHPMTKNQKLTRS